MSRFGAKIETHTILCKIYCKPSEKETCPFIKISLPSSPSKMKWQSNSQIQSNFWKCWQKSKPRESTNRCWSTMGKKVMRMAKSAKKERINQWQVHQESTTSKTLLGETIPNSIQAKSQRKETRTPAIVKLKGYWIVWSQAKANTNPNANCTLRMAWLLNDWSFTILLHLFWLYLRTFWFCDSNDNDQIL